MFANIRRHQKWLWILISGAVIISFVWYFNPNSKYGGGGGANFDSSVGSINGRPISRLEYFNASKEAELRYLFSYGEWPGNDEFTRQNKPVERETRNRLFLVEKVRQHNIQVPPPAIAKWIAEAFRDRDKNIFDPTDYQRFLTQRLQPHGLTESDFERFVRHEVAFQHLIAVAGIPGKLVTPQEAEVQYRRENEEADTEAVFFNASNYVAQVNLDPMAIATHYTNQGSLYRIPERIQLSYVSFEASNYFPQADLKIAAETNLAQRLDQLYLQRGAKFYTDTNGQALPPEGAKAKIREEIRENIALVEARKAASGFAQELFDLPGAHQVANLENLAAAKGIVSKTTEPFTQMEGPKGLDVPERFTQIAFQLSASEPFPEDHIAGQSAAYVAGLKKRIPSELPPLDAIREKVTADYTKAQSQTLARQAGIAFHAQLTNSVAQGKTFQQAAEAAGQKTVDLPAFSQASHNIKDLDPRVDVTSLKNAAFALQAGQSSGFTSTRDGGFVIHVSKFVPAADGAVKAALPGYLSNLQRAGQSEAFNAWFTKEMEGAKLLLATDKQDDENGAKQ